MLVEIFIPCAIGVVVAGMACRRWRQPPIYSVLNNYSSSLFT